jgi:hypothetical protein
MGWMKGILDVLKLSRRQVRRRDGYRTWHDFVSELERSAFLQRVDEFRPHAVIVEYIWLTRLIVNLPARVQRSTLLVLDSHDVMHERTQAFLNRNRPLQSGADTNEEADALRHFDIVLAIQQHEARKLSALCADVEVLTVLHGLETTPLDAPNTGAHRLLYVGSNAEPNIEGLQDFIGSVWTALVAQRDDIFLDVVGGVCGSFDQSETHPSIAFHGVVDDLDSFYRRASLVVAPIP